MDTLSIALSFTQFSSGSRLVHVVDPEKLMPESESTVGLIRAGKPEHIQTCLDSSHNSAQKVNVPQHHVIYQSEPSRQCALIEV